MASLWRFYSFLFFRVLLFTAGFLLLTEAVGGLVLGEKTFDQFQELGDPQGAVDAIGDADQFKSSAAFADLILSADDFADAHAVDDWNIGQIQ